MARQVSLPKFWKSAALLASGSQHGIVGGLVLVFLLLLFLSCLEEFRVATLGLLKD